MRTPAPAAPKRPASARRRNAVHLGNVAGRSGEPGADGPDRLVGQHRVGGADPVRQRCESCLLHHRERQAGPALARGLADADDGREAGAMRGQRLAPHVAGAFAVIGAALGMAHDDGAGARIPEHLGAKCRRYGPRAPPSGSPAPRPPGASLAPALASSATRVAGGQIMTSTAAAKPGSSSRSCTRRASPRAAARPFIFQFPATRGRMPAVVMAVALSFLLRSTGQGYPLLHASPRAESATTPPWRAQWGPAEAIDHEACRGRQPFIG